MLEFKKVKMESTKGIQPSKWDELDGQLEPGEAAEFDNETKQAVAQGAARLRKLTGKPYHSGYNTLTKKTFIRLRPDGEVPSREDTDEEEKNEQQGQTSFLD
jgi:hypothetical protein